MATGANWRERGVRVASEKARHYNHEGYVTDVDDDGTVFVCFPHLQGQGEWYDGLELEPLEENTSDWQRWQSAAGL